MNTTSSGPFDQSPSPSLAQAIAKCSNAWELARTYAAFGIPVLPVSPKTRRPCNLRGHHAATVDPSKIDEWWGREYPGAMIGIPTGPSSGFWVVDLDKKGGKDGVARLQVLGFNVDIAGCIVQTPSGGMHLVFRYQPGTRIATTAGSVGHIETDGQSGSGIDVRGTSAFKVNSEKGPNHDDHTRDDCRAFPGIVSGGFIIAAGSVRDDIAEPYKLAVGDYTTAWEAPPDLMLHVTFPAALAKRVLADQGLCATLRATDLRAWAEVVEHHFVASAPSPAASPSPTREAPATGSSNSERWDGKENTLEFVIAMLRHIARSMAAARETNTVLTDQRGDPIDIRRMAFWISMGRALHHYFGGKQIALRLWIAMTTGSEEYGIAGCPSCYHADELLREFNSFGPKAGRPTTIFTIREYARRLGWNSGPEDFGIVDALPSEGGARVRDAAAAYLKLRPGQRTDARFSVIFRAAALRFTGPEILLLSVITGLLNNKSGFAWPSHAWLAEVLSNADGEAWTIKGVRTRLAALAKAGLIVVSDADKVGAHGRKGPTYCIVPSERDWQEDIDWYLRHFNHGHDSGTTFNNPDTPASNPGQAYEGGAQDSGQDNTSLKDTTTFSLSSNNTNSFNYSGVLHRVGDATIGPVVQSVSGGGAGTATHPLLSHPDLPGVLRDAIGRALAHKGTKSQHLPRLADKLDLLRSLGCPAGEISRTLMAVSARIGKAAPPSKSIEVAVDALVELIGNRDLANAADLEQLARDREKARQWTRGRGAQPSQPWQQPGQQPWQPDQSPPNPYGRARNGE